MKKTVLAVVLGLSVAALAGCNKEPVGNEPYVGVPKDGKSCQEAYSQPANVTKCVGQDSRH